MGCTRAPQHGYESERLSLSKISADRFEFRFESIEMAPRLSRVWVGLALVASASLGTTRLRSRARGGSAYTGEEPESLSFRNRSETGCAVLCDPAGAWKSTSCQNCIFRGLVNEWNWFNTALWTYPHVDEPLKPYPYTVWAYQECRHLNDSPHAHMFHSCYLKELHNACNK